MVLASWLWAAILGFVKPCDTWCQISRFHCFLAKLEQIEARPSIDWVDLMEWLSGLSHTWIKHWFSNTMWSCGLVHHLSTIVETEESELSNRLLVYLLKWRILRTLQGWACDTISVVPEGLHEWVNIILKSVLSIDDRTDWVESLEK